MKKEHIFLGKKQKVKRFANGGRVTSVDSTKNLSALEKLKTIDLSKIDNEKLKSLIAENIKNISNKDIDAELDEQLKSLYLLVQKKYPDAIRGGEKEKSKHAKVITENGKYQIYDVYGNKVGDPKNSLSETDKVIEKMPTELKGNYMEDAATGYGFRNMGNKAKESKPKKDKKSRAKKYSADNLMNIDAKAWDILKINSGSALYSDVELQKKYIAYLDKAISKALLSDAIQDKIEDENYHSLNMYLAMRGFYGTNVKAEYTKILEKQTGNNFDLSAFGESKSEAKETKPVHKTEPFTESQSGGKSEQEKESTTKVGNKLLKKEDGTYILQHVSDPKKTAAFTLENGSYKIDCCDFKKEDYPEYKDIHSAVEHVERKWECKEAFDKKVDERKTRKDREKRRAAQGKPTVLSILESVNKMTAVIVNKAEKDEKLDDKQVKSIENAGNQYKEKVKNIVQK